MSDLRALFALADSAVVEAGAGTGKTHSIVTLCLHLLGGVGRAEPLPPARLWAVTFTEKAAAELKGRIRERIDALCERASANVTDIEPELAAAGYDLVLHDLEVLPDAEGATSDDAERIEAEYLDLVEAIIAADPDGDSPSS